MAEQPTSQTTSRPHKFVAYLRECRREGALWTSDISGHFRISTAAARRELVRLEKAGQVERVVIGNPTSWRPASYE